MFYFYSPFSQINMNMQRRTLTINSLTSRCKLHGPVKFICPQELHHNCEVNSNLQVIMSLVDNGLVTTALLVCMQPYRRISSLTGCCSKWMCVSSHNHWRLLLARDNTDGTRESGAGFLFIVSSTNRIVWGSSSWLWLTSTSQVNSHGTKLHCLCRPRVPARFISPGWLSASAQTLFAHQSGNMSRVKSHINSFL